MYTYVYKKHIQSSSSNLKYKKKQMFINSKMDNLWHIHMWMKMK